MTGDRADDETVRVDLNEHVEVREEVERRHDHVSVSASSRPRSLPPRRARGELLAHRLLIVLGVLLLLGFWVFLIRICFHFFSS